jgi:ATP-dependent DNA helicase RecG
MGSNSLAKTESDANGRATEQIGHSPRPEPLFALFAPVQGLPGVGPATVRRLARLLGRAEPRRLDLVAHLPVGLIDPEPLATLAGAAEGDAVTLEVLVLRHHPAGGGRAPSRIDAEAAGLRIELAFFGARGDTLERRFPVGERRLVHGRLGRFRERWQLTHPELVEPAADGTSVPIYRLSEGLTQGGLRRIVRGALDRLPPLPEWLEPEAVAARARPAWNDALRAVHAPATARDLEPTAPARQRLAYDELLAGQLALAITRRRRSAAPGRPLAGDAHLRTRLLASLPYALTVCQERAIAEIGADLAAPAPMTRLLQGDVGSGKTLVALAAMLQAVEAGAQAALMAPTEVLARQHATTLTALLTPLGIEVELLTGSEPAPRRRQALLRIAEGRVPIAVGTHALFQAGVAFRALGLAVVDEQHRFGVAQRLALLDKGEAADLLLMSATPIPRTLLLAVHGDVAVSSLRTKPPGRQPIETRLVSTERMDELLDGIERALASGERAYWICPLVEGSEAVDQTAALERHASLRERFGATVDVVHGRLPAPEKAAAIASFAAGRTRLLVATTVIEVGIDVPEAGIIVIEQAERFGLAQLHQLRGRVGRGGQKARCVLLYRPPLGATARQRLTTLRRTEDGFRIAEADLTLRGPGEVLGTRQSGLPQLRFADLMAHADLLEEARADAEAMLAHDPGLRSPRGRALQVLMHLFERQEALPLLAAG